MTRAVYCYTQMTETEPGRREAAMIFPQVECLLAMFRYGAMCEDIDGNRTGFADLFDQGIVHGFVSNVIRDFGFLAVVEVTCTDEGFAAVLAAHDTQNPLIYGDTPLEFKQAATQRRNFLYRKMKEWRPVVANRIDSLDDIRWLIAHVPADDVVTARFQAWMLGRIDGTTTDVLPRGLVDETGNWIDFSSARQVWNRWRQESEGMDYKILMRLWEFYCLNHILLLEEG